MVKRRDFGWLTAESGEMMLGWERKWYLGRDRKLATLEICTNGSQKDQQNTKKGIRIGEL
jgi:hypothetical protein